MRDLIRQVLQGYKSLKLEGQQEGFVQFSGQEPDSQQAVSIKILPRLIGQDPEIAKRFDDLARAMRQLNHPNIVPVRKTGEEAGLPYIVTRTLEKSHSLAAKLDQPWAVDAAADVVAQVGLALEHAYNKGVVHGGLTPDQIAVQNDGRVLVTDFGLDEMMALVGVHVKKAASPYLAPERMAGKPADARADVYSLAAILYGMLTKRKPQVVTGQVLPPSRFNPEVSQRMDDVVVRALAHNPADRYPDVKTFLAALGASTVVPAEQAQVVASEKICPRCGTENQSGRFCRKCGFRLGQPQAVPPSQPQAVPPSQSQAVPPSQPQAVPPARPQAAPPSRTLPPSRPLARKPVPKGAALDEPIQVTKIEVGRVHVGKGVEVRETVIARPLEVVSLDLDVEFPEPLAMPEFDVDLWAAMEQEPAIAMPEPPAMPALDWAEIAPPMPQVPVIEDDPASGESG